MYLVCKLFNNLYQHILNKFRTQPIKSSLFFFAIGLFAYNSTRFHLKRKYQNKYIQINSIDCEKIKSLLNPKDYFQKLLQNKLPYNYLNNFSPIGKNDQHRILFQTIFNSLQSNNFDPKQLNLNQKQSRAIACMLGMAICDALGASTEFKNYKRNGHGIIKQGFSDIKKAIKQGRLGSRHGTVGIWTDDASMGLVMGYGLIFSNYNFDPILTRQMFHLWWNQGLGNGGRDHSIGLGGNISISMSEFQDNPNQPFTYQGKQNNNGNGSLMRLAPIPIAFHKDITKACQVAMKQSLTTHNGLQAKECARLMTEIIVNLINRGEYEDGKQIILKTCGNFKSEVKSVICLANSKKQTQDMWNQSSKNEDFRKFNKTIDDRNWNWKDKEFEYSPTRLIQNSGYIGSYCMDGLAMALHIVYHTNSFKECAIRNADIGGDCDTVGSIAGQIAGAIYGIDDEMLRLYSQMEDFIDKKYEVFLCGYKLFHNQSIQLENINGSVQKQQMQKDKFFESKESQNQED